MRSRSGKPSARISAGSSDSGGPCWGRDGWIYYRVERWNRVGAFGVGQGWDLRALVPESEVAIFQFLEHAPGTTIGPWSEVHSDKNYLEGEETVKVPDDAPEYAETENIMFH